MSELTIKQLYRIDKNSIKNHEDGLVELDELSYHFAKERIKMYEGAKAELEAKNERLRERVMANHLWFERIDPDYYGSAHRRKNLELLKEQS